MTAFAVALTVLTSLQIGGDAPPRAADDVAPVAVETPDPADRLAAEAYRLFTDRRSWPRAARMLEQSADLRSLDDPERAETYLAAGRVYSHLKARADALRAFTAAAEAATARGAIAVAAHAYLDAALAAALAGDRGAADDFLERGVLLASSPHLQVGERQSILSRVPEKRIAAGG